VAAFALVDEDVLQSHGPSENGNLDVNTLFEFSDDSISCGFAKLNATEKRLHTLDTTFLVMVVNLKCEERKRWNNPAIVLCSRQRATTTMPLAALVGLRVLFDSHDDIPMLYALRADHVNGE
jgi:hypothetical protein